MAAVEQAQKWCRVCSKHTCTGHLSRTEMWACVAREIASMHLKMDQLLTEFNGKSPCGPVIRCHIGCGCDRQREWLRMDERLRYYTAALQRAQLLGEV